MGRRQTQQFLVVKQRGDRVDPVKRRAGVRGTGLSAELGQRQRGAGRKVLDRFGKRQALVVLHEGKDTLPAALQPKQWYTCLSSLTEKLGLFSL